VIAIALAYQGYEYQHHHIPDFDPPQGWPWKEVGSGHNGKGVDCSNFTSFVYNLGYGLKPSGAIHTQAEEHRIPGPGEGHYTQAIRIQRPSSYEAFSRELKTGDLLFVRRQNKKEISHVVIWVGSVGRSPDNEPLIIDSHGEGVHDSNGKTIPSGIYLRPFRKTSWYFREADHALRLLHDES
jgi:cell wall-associated NlpC family hydrolase